MGTRCGPYLELRMIGVPAGSGVDMAGARIERLINREAGIAVGAEVKKDMGALALQMNALVGAALRPRLTACGVGSKLWIDGATHVTQLISKCWAAYCPSQGLRLRRHPVTPVARWASSSTYQATVLRFWVK